MLLESIPTLDDVDVKGKRVLVRCDVNCPVNQDKRIKDTTTKERLFRLKRKNKVDELKRLTLIRYITFSLRRSVVIGTMYTQRYAKDCREGICMS